MEFLMAHLLDTWIDSYFLDRPNIVPPEKNAFGEYVMPRWLRDAFAKLISENEKLSQQQTTLQAPDNWNHISEGDWPAIGEKVILRRNNVVQNEIFDLDQGDNDYGTGEHFWNREDLDECPPVNDGDSWISLTSL
jgi:hypothetical protein